MPHKLDRRDILFGTAAAVVTVGATAVRLGISDARAAVAALEPKPLGLDPTAIKGLSERTITSHYENNYKGAITRLNSINTELAKLDPSAAPGFVLSGLKREQLIAMNSMILHEVHFASLGVGGNPGGDLAAALARDFGSVDAWRNEFITGLGLKP